MTREAGTIVLDELIDELARVIHEPEVGRMLARKMGVPPGDVPAFDVPRVFWDRVVRAAAGGKLTGGVRTIVEIATGEYPGNEAFQTWRGRDESGSREEQHDPLARVRREIIDFATERGRHACFFGREDVLAEMDAWIEARESGWLLISGGPGLGKSALMDRWLRRREEAGSLTAFHFIRRGHKNWADPAVVQANLAAQVELMFPERRDAEAKPEYRLEQLLQRVSMDLLEADRWLVLLVDGLDEATTLGGRNAIPDMFPLEVPPRVFVVTATRPQYPHLGWFELRNGPSGLLDLDQRAKSNEGAVRAYWTSLGKQMLPPLDQNLVEAAIGGAQGNLLHAVKLHELWSRSDAERSVAKMPRGFEGMLEELWQRTGTLPREAKERVRDGLSLICAARESLPLRVVDELLGWDEGEAEDELLPLTREMLLEEPWHEEPSYRPFHEGLRELMVSKRKRSSAACCAKLAEYAAWPVEGDAFQRSYALRHRVEHLVEIGSTDAAARAVMDVGYLTAKACAQGVVAIEWDIRLARDVQAADDTRARVSVLGQMVTRSAHWVAKVPEALPALLHDRTLTNAPELLGDLHLASALSEHPRLRHALRPHAMARVLEGHQDSVAAVAILPGRRVVSGSWDGTLRVWDVDSGRPLATLQGHQGWVLAVVVLPDGRVVSASSDKTLRVWNVDSGRPLATLQGHQDRVVAVAMLPDGRVVSGSDDSTLRVWNVDSGHTLAVLQGHRRRVNAVTVLPDSRVVSGSNDKTLRVWDVDSGRILATLQGHQGPVQAVAVLPDGHVVSGSDDKTLRVWDVDSGRILATLQSQGSVDAVAVRSNGHVISGSWDNTLRVWDVNSERPLATLQGHQNGVLALAMLPDGRVVSGSADDTLRVWDVDSSNSLATRHGHQGIVWAMAVLPDGRIVSGSEDNTLRVWDVDSGRTLITLNGHEQGVMAVVVLPDGRIVSGSNDATLRIWDVDSGRTLATLHGHRAAVNALAVLDDGRVVSGSGDKTLRVWDVDSGRTLATLHGHQHRVLALAVLPDGRVVSSSDDNTLRVWDVDSGRTLATLHGHQGSVNAVSVLPDGRIISGADDNTLRVWDADSGRTLVTLHGHQDSVIRLAVLPDSRVVSGSDDNTLRVWDADSECLVTTVYGDASFYSIAIVTNDLIVAGDDFGDVWFIELPPWSRPSVRARS